MKRLNILTLVTKVELHFLYLGNCVVFSSVEEKFTTDFYMCLPTILHLQEELF